MEALSTAIANERTATADPDPEETEGRTEPTLSPQDDPAGEAKARVRNDRASQTEYIVLHHTGKNSFEGIGVYPAADRDSAIKTAIEAMELEEGTFVAVPTRYFEPRPAKVTVERKTTVEFG